MNTKERPAHEIRIGAIKGAVWKNQTETGARYNATFRRIYKDGDKWNSSDSFGKDDLLLLRKVADQAHSWICAQNQDGSNAAQAQPDADPQPAHPPRPQTGRR